MRKVYKHKVYDTSTAEHLCNTPHGNLYRKNSTLSFFLVSRNGIVITPVSWVQAEKLIMEYGTREQYNQLFRPEIYSNRERAKERITVSMNRNDYSMLRILAGHRDMSIGQYIHATVDERYRALEHRRKSQN